MTATIEPQSVELPAGRKHHYPSNRKRTPRKLNQRLALIQAKRGMSNADIARAQGVGQSTIGDFMKRMKPERAALEDFKTGRADVLASMQALSLDVQEKILLELRDRDLTGLSAGQISGLVLALNAQHGTTFDKERLERGQSTSNQSVVSRLLDSEVRNLYRNPAPVAQVTLPSEECAAVVPVPVQGPGSGISKRGPAGGSARNRNGARSPAGRTTRKKPKA